MKKIAIVTLVFCIFQSCIPVRIAPQIDNYKVTKGKKFKRELSKREMFIFEDPKEEGQFYNYINTKYQLEDQDVYDDVPFLLNGEQYFFAWYEVEIPNKTINLAPLVVDVFINAALGNEEMDPITSNDDSFVLRKGNWYLAIEVYSDLEKDCLDVGSLSRELVLNYLHTLKTEYLATHNYNETLFKD